MTWTEKDTYKTGCRKEHGNTTDESKYFDTNETNWKGITDHQPMDKTKINYYKITNYSICSGLNCYFLQMKYIDIWHKYIEYCVGNKYTIYVYKIWINRIYFYLQTHIWIWKCCDHI